jgi:hypothetical protein
LLALTLLGLVAALLAARATPAPTLARSGASAVRTIADAVRPSAAAAIDAPAVIAAPPVADRASESAADRRVRRAGYETIPGGVLYAPSSFASADGSYDLLLHFHGNVKVVVESAEAAGLNAIVAVVNLGIGSAPYQDAYAVPGSYEALLADVQRAVGARGLVGPRLRRVALSSWSAGYGALSSILEQRRGTDRLDALLVLDGIHCGWLEERPDALNHRQLASFAGAARMAAAGEMLFTITHSAIIPPGYASAEATASYLLDAVGASRHAAALPPSHLILRAMYDNVARTARELRLEPTTEAAKGGFHVRGFRGETKEHHMAHLFQMGATVLPELVARWEGQRDAR